MHSNIPRGGTVLYTSIFAIFEVSHYRRYFFIIDIIYNVNRRSSGTFYTFIPSSLECRTTDQAQLAYVDDEVLVYTTHREGRVFTGDLILVLAGRGRMSRDSAIGVEAFNVS